MAYRKLILPFFFISSGIFQISAQKNPVLYAGFDYYRDTEFKNNSFGNFNIGSQLFHWNFFAPEIGFEYYHGTLEDRNFRSENFGRQIAGGIFESNFSASFLSFNPKLKFGRDDAFFSLSPKYHVGKVVARGRYFKLNENGRNYILEESQKRSSPVWFWSFSIGFEGLAITEKYWFALFLNYTEVSANDAFSLLDFSEYDIKPMGSIPRPLVSVFVFIIILFLPKTIECIFNKKPS